MRCPECQGSHFWLDIYEVSSIAFHEDEVEVHTEFEEVTGIECVTCGWWSTDEETLAQVSYEVKQKSLLSFVGYGCGQQLDGDQS